MDILLQAAAQATITTLLTARGLISPVADKAGTWFRCAPGFTYCWWAESGKLMKSLPVPDPQNPMGPPLTPATFVPGFVMLCRITDPADVIDNPDDDEQYSRSRIMRFIKTNGVLGTFQGFPCYTLSSVRAWRARDVFKWLSDNGLPAHEFMGGNSI